MRDPRGFEYPLDGQVSRVTWRLDRAIADLAVAGRELQTLEREAAEADAVWGERVRVRTDAGARIDPMLSMANVRFLVELQRRAQDAARRRDLARARADTLMRRVAATQAELDGLADDRRACVVAHVRESERVAARDGDDAWLARPRAVRDEGAPA